MFLKYGDRMSADAGDANARAAALISLGGGVALWLFVWLLQRGAEPFAVPLPEVPSPAGAARTRREIVTYLVAAGGGLLLVGLAGWLKR